MKWILKYETSLIENKRLRNIIKVLQQSKNLKWKLSLYIVVFYS